MLSNLPIDNYSQLNDQLALHHQHQRRLFGVQLQQHQTMFNHPLRTPATTNNAKIDHGANHVAQVNHVMRYNKTTAPPPGLEPESESTNRHFPTSSLNAWIENMSI
jgi:hypothetical protein